MKQNNFIYLFIGILIFLLIAPAVRQWFPVNSPVILQVAFIAMMIIGVWSLQADKGWFLLGLLLAFFGIILGVLDIFTDAIIIHLASLIILLLFCVLSATVAMRQILFVQKIDANKLFGSVCIYLLIGIAWSLLYVFVNYANHDSFIGIVEETDHERLWEFIYFSFVTLTTLGYGDISPVSPLARSLAYLEAIFGQIYIAILVASLVGAYLSGRQSTDK